MKGGASEPLQVCVRVCLCVKLRQGKSPLVVTAERKRVTNVNNIYNNNNDDDENRPSSSPAAPRLPLNTSATLRPARDIFMDRLKLLKLPPNRCDFSSVPLQVAFRDGGSGGGGD